MIYLIQYALIYAIRYALQYTICFASNLAYFVFVFEMKIFFYMVTNYLQCAFLITWPIEIFKRFKILQFIVTKNVWSDNWNEKFSHLITSKVLTSSQEQVVSEKRFYAIHLLQGFVWTYTWFRDILRWWKWWLVFRGNLKISNIRNCLKLVI